MLEGRNHHYGHEGNSALGVESGGEKKERGLPEGEGGHTITSAEPGSHDGDLGLALLRGPQGTMINTKVLWAVEDSSTLLGECYGRHWGEEAKGGRRRGGRERGG